MAEEYLQDHFPGFSNLPGVFMVEAMVQTCAWLSRVTDDFQHSVIVLKQAKAVKFNHFLKPGQTLNLTATMKKNEDETASFVASGKVGDISAVSARITLLKKNLRDHREDMAGADERILESMKTLYNQVNFPEVPIESV